MSYRALPTAGTCVFHDPRKNPGRLSLIKDPGPDFDPPGPEPLAPGFTAKALGQLLKNRQRILKPLLLDQTFIAGLGNIYVDEALWEAKLHPCRRASSLSTPEIRALRLAIPRVLKRGLKNLGTSLGSGEANFYSVANRRGRNKDQLNVFRRTDRPCPRCKQSIERLIVGQRSTHICPRCQEILKTQYWSDGMEEQLIREGKIPNYKSQISNKFQ